MSHVRQAIVDTPQADPALLTESEELRQRLNALLTRIRGDQTRGKRNEPTAPSIIERVQNVVSSQWYTTSGPTQTEQDAYRYAGTEFADALKEVRQLADKLQQLEERLEAAGGPWTPGRIPTWELE